MDKMLKVRKPFMTFAFPFTKIVPGLVSWDDVTQNEPK